MATKKKAASRRKIAAVWERGYQGHVYWLGKEKLGKVSLLAGSAADPRGKYRWDAAGKRTAWEAHGSAPGCALALPRRQTPHGARA